MQSQLAQDSHPFCLRLPSAGITGVYCPAQPWNKEWIYATTQRNIENVTPGEGKTSYHSILRIEMSRISCAQWLTLLPSTRRPKQKMLKSSRPTGLQIKSGLKNRKEKRKRRKQKQRRKRGKKGNVSEGQMNTSRDYIGSCQELRDEGLTATALSSFGSII